MSDWYDPEPFFTPPRSRSEVVAEHLARLVTPDLSDPPAVAERKRQEAKARLAAQDRLFGNYYGASLGARRPYDVGDDPEARED